MSRGSSGCSFLSRQRRRPLPGRLPTGYIERTQPTTQVRSTSITYLLPSHDYDGALDLDLGHLLAADPAPLPAGTLAARPERLVSRQAAAVVAALLKAVRRLPSTPVPEGLGRLVELPPPKTALPREKPLPAPRPPTKWEKFAQEKGIVSRKTKRSKMVFDDTATDEHTGEKGAWRRRHGTGRIEDGRDVGFIDAKPSDEPGVDPFAALGAERKANKKENEKKRVANLRHAATKGGQGALPATVRLTAGLDPSGAAGRKKGGYLEDRGAGGAGKGPKERLTRRDLLPEVVETARRAGVSTASLGKFDKRSRGEAAADRDHARVVGAGARRKHLPTTDTSGRERDVSANIVGRILRERADDIVDLDRAAAKGERAAGAERTAARVAEARAAGGRVDTKIARGKGGKALHKRKGATQDARLTKTRGGGTSKGGRPAGAGRDPHRALGTGGRKGTDRGARKGGLGGPDLRSKGGGKKGGKR